MASALSCNTVADYLHHVVGGSLVRLLFEVHGGLGVGDGTVLLVPVVVLDHWRNSIGVHQDVTAKKRCLEENRVTSQNVKR